MLLQLRILVLGTTLCCFALAGHCASIDCHAKRSKLEDAICADDEWSALDDVLATTYKLVLQISEKKSALKSEQKRWLSDVRKQCKDNNCLIEAYAVRISALASQWEQRTRAINLDRARRESPTASPFEGEWQTCQLWKGKPICLTSKFVQVGNKVCGEVEDWASGTYYVTRVQASIKGVNQTEINSQCGIPATSDVPIECNFDDDDPGKWQKTFGIGYSICMGQLLPLNAPCSSEVEGAIHSRLSGTARKELLDEAWVQRCLRTD